MGLHIRQIVLQDLLSWMSETGLAVIDDDGDVVPGSDVQRMFLSHGEPLSVEDRTYILQRISGDAE